MDMMANSVNDSTLDSSRSLSRMLWVFIGIGLFVVAAIFLSHKIYKAQPAQVLIDPTGLNSTEYNQLVQVMSARDVGNFFTTSLPQLQEAALDQSWVGQVNIERKWGKGIVVSALPRVPVARFGSEHLIDAEGHVFEPANEKDLQRNDLIMLQGDNAQSTLIMQQMQLINKWFAPLDLKVDDMVLTPRMTWVVKFNDGTRLIVDNEHTSQKLMNLSQLLQNQLTTKRNDIDSVDLRYKNGFVIAWKNEAVAPIELRSVSELKGTKDNQDIERL